MKNCSRLLTTCLIMHNKYFKCFMSNCSDNYKDYKNKEILFFFIYISYIIYKVKKCSKKSYPDMIFDIKN